MGNVNRYSDREQAVAKSELLNQTKMQLAQGFRVADIYLNRSYLENFSNAPIIPIKPEMLRTSSMRLLEITKLVFDANEKFTDKLMSVYSALYNINSSVATILSSDGVTIHFYIGIRSERNSAVALDILESALRGNFPGVVIDVKESSDISRLISNFQTENKSLATVSIVPSLRDEDDKDIESFVQGLEKFIDTMSGKAFTAISIATPLDAATIERRKHGYEELYSSMSPHAKLSVAYGKNESYAVNKSISSGFSTSVNRSVSNSNSTSTSHSSGTNQSYSSGDSFNMNFSGDGSSFGFGSNSGESSGSFSSYTSGNTFTQSVSDSTGSTSSESISKGETETQGTSDTITIDFENKGVQNLLDRAQMQLERFKKCESFGMWEFCSYFFAKDIKTTALAGNTYKALMTGNESNVESAHINMWSLNKTDSIDSILKYITHFIHPIAEMPSFDGGYSKQMVTPTNLVSGNELPLVMGLPKKSVSGLAVVEMAEFGRAVVYENKPPKRSIQFGNIYHMGVVEKPRVNMDLDLLSSHCFITGSSGSGKSYATYQLLDAALAQGTKILIVEPAKGEYKQIFGGLHGIKIYTTDPNTYRILRINPFQFPESIHILSHIEQLLQIFSAAWPLYAAMPAILKQAVVDSYTACGWDVQNSIWVPGICDHKYPVFADVLKILPEIINKSDYSADSKGDYKGALVTRVQAMTVGITGMIFRKSEGIDDSALFDSNVVVDLSELGSDEAIALIMGILIMKLSEHRKAERKQNPKLSLNSDLRHLTVLEEAHNLLKRTSKEQSQEGANMVGKSVEMISNSIKEMRTYGEGFLIIDQSPMAVDSSAIENTSTKIIMNTPAKDACEEVGSALSLNDEQTKELSKLNVGVAAVFQKGWLSPVLMKIDKWDDRYNTTVEATDPGVLKVVKGMLLQQLYEQKERNNFNPIQLRRVTQNACRSIDAGGLGLPADKKRELDDIVLSFDSYFANEPRAYRHYFSKLVVEIIGCEQLFSILPCSDVRTYAELSKISDPELRKKNVKEFKKAVKSYCMMLDNALSLYIVADEKLRLSIILDLLFVFGEKGKVKYYPHNRLAMICREFHRQLGYSLL